MSCRYSVLKLDLESRHNSYSFGKKPLGEQIRIQSDSIASQEEIHRLS